ncbi:MAG: nuclear transport factor 2 family protein [Candidatus Acidiferrales bacterium]
MTKRYATYALALGILFGIFAALTGNQVAAAVDDDAVLQADHSFVQAISKSDSVSLGKLLDADFAWTDSDGKTQTKAEILGNLPTPVAGYDSTAKERTYGDVGTVQASSGKAYVLRVWVKRPSGWRALVYHEVVQLAVPPAAGGPGVKDCENPCKKLPYHPQNEVEQGVISSWQELETAVTNHDSAGWAPHVAEEFILVSSNNDHPVNKEGRMAVLDKQKQAAAGSAPAPLVSALMFDFPDTVVMTGLHQPFHGKPIHVSRVWIKRDGKWVLSISYQTTVQAAPAQAD